MYIWGNLLNQTIFLFLSEGLNNVHCLLELKIGEEAADNERQEGISEMMKFVSYLEGDI